MMSTKVASSRKRKTVFWNPKPTKKRKLNKTWFKTVKNNRNDNNVDLDELVKYAIETDKDIDEDNNDINNDDINNNDDDANDEDDNAKDDDDDNTEFEIVKQDNNYNDSKIVSIDINTGSSVLKIKFATPTKGKHSEYNLKSLKESMIELEKNKVIDDETNDEGNDMNISIGANIISASSEWSKLGEINKHLIKHIKDKMKLLHPTIIQTKSIPYLLDNKDLLIKSETGSGKTLAYLIPIISDLMNEIIERKDGCKVMIIAPTRELCIQIFNVTNKLCRHTPFIVIGHLMGGQDKKKEKQKLRKGLSVIIGTPGRILDHFENTRCFKFNLIKWLVLDEADILLNLGFEKFIRSIVKIIDQNTIVTNRCNILVSATLDHRIEKLAKLILKKHIFISLNEGNNDKLYIPATLKHHYICLKREYQSVGLIGLLRMLYYQNLHENKNNESSTFKAIIFMSTCKVIKYYYSLFKQAKLFPNGSKYILPTESLNLLELRGDMTQKDRTDTYFKFCNLTNGILFCTDVASRGLDIPKVNYIIQYDPPSNLQDYIHRSGRTARIGNIGQTILFLTPKEIKYLDILKQHKFKFTQIPIGHIWNQLDIDYQKYKVEDQPKGEQQELSSRNIIIDHLKDSVSNDEELKKKAREAMQTFVKAYTTYPRQLKSIFYVSNLDFYQLSKCFFIQRQGRFLRKGGMKHEIKRHKQAQKVRKQQLPSTISEFAAN